MAETGGIFWPAMRFAVRAHWSSQLLWRPTSMLLSKVRTSSENGVKVLAMRGEFTGGDETDELRNALAAEADAGTNSLLIDLENATYLNSTALGVLIAAHTNFSKRG